jgi:hypothetical protein
MSIRVENDALVAAEFAGATWRREHLVTGSGEHFAEFVDGVRGSQREAKMHDRRRASLPRSPLASVAPLVELHADAAKIQDNAATIEVGVPAMRQRDASEQQVEIEEPLDIVGSERDVLELGERRAARITHGTYAYG